MTDIVPASTPTSVAVADPEALARKYAGVGMEDIDQTDIVVPRLKIEHAEGKYLDTLSNETFEKLECVVLGVVKQRSLFPAVMDEESHKPPLCKSNDFTYGNPSEEIPWARRVRSAPVRKLPPQGVGLAPDHQHAVVRGAAHLRPDDPGR